MPLDRLGLGVRAPCDAGWADGAAWIAWLLAGLEKFGAVESVQRGPTAQVTDVAAPRPGRTSPRPGSHAAPPPPGDPAVAGLVAHILLTDARRHTRRWWRCWAG